MSECCLLVHDCVGFLYAFAVHLHPRQCNQLLPPQFAGDSVRESERVIMPISMSV